MTRRGFALGAAASLALMGCDVGRFGRAPVRRQRLQTQGGALSTAEVFDEDSLRAKLGDSTVGHVIVARDVTILAQLTINRPVWITFIGDIVIGFSVGKTPAGGSEIAVIIDTGATGAVLESTSAAGFTVISDVTELVEVRAHRVVCRGLTFAPATGVTLDTALYVTGADDVVAEECDITAAATALRWTGSGNRGHMRFNTIRGSAAIVVSNGSHHEMNGNVCTAASNITVVAGRDNRIENNDVNGGNIDTSGAGGHSVIIGNAGTTAGATVFTAGTDLAGFNT